MTIDEAIKHCEEVMLENLEKTKDRNASDPIAINCFECADEHMQLAEWLKDYKRLLEQEPSGDCISRQAALDCFTATKLKKFDFILYAREEIKKLPSVNPQPCEDAISRKALISHIENQSREWGEDYDAQQILGDIEDMPSVKQDCDNCEVGNPCLYCKHEFEPQERSEDDNN